MVLEHLPEVINRVSFVFRASIARRPRSEAGLRDDAAATATGTTVVGINGSRGGGLGLGDVGGDGEERGEEIHWCVRVINR